jgi:hypothetical protein
MTDQTPVFVLDEAIGIASLQEIIREHGAQCKLLTDHFERGTPDRNWLPFVGKNNWILLTKDKRIQKNSIEYQALINAKVGAFFLVSGSISREEILQCVIKAMPKMIALAQSQSKPFLAKVYKDGSVKLWFKPG